MEPRKVTTMTILAWSLVILLCALGFANAQNETGYNPACLLSQRQNQTFTEAGFVITPRASDEVTFLASGGWSPSMDARASMLRLGNDTVVPVFWLQAIALSAPGTLVDFFDSRFQLCVTFVTANLLSPSITSCAVGSTATPGQFRFQGILLPSGNWVFSAVSLTFSPLRVVVPLSASQSPQLCCLNVSAPQLLVTDAPTLLRFSPRLSSPQGLWYSGKQVCYTSGASLAPFAIEAVHLSNDTVGGSSLLSEPRIAVARSDWVFSVALHSTVVGGNTTVVASVTIAAGSKMTATFTNLVLGSVAPVASAVVVVEARQLFVSQNGGMAEATASNNAVALNTLMLHPRVVPEGCPGCALGFGQHRGSGTLTAYFGRWGAPTAPTTELPVLALLALDGTNSVTSSSNPTKSAPDSVYVSAVDEEGTDQSALLWEHSRSRVIADGMAVFDGLSFVNISNVSATASPTAEGLLVWLRFTLVRSDDSAGGLDVEATTMPIRLLSDTSLVAHSSALPAVANLMRVAPGRTQFTTDGVLVPATQNQSVGPAAVVLQDARGLFLPLTLGYLGIEVAVTAQVNLCHNSNLPLKKSLVDNVNVLCSADPSTAAVTIATTIADSTGVALFPLLAVPSFSVRGRDYYVLLQFVVETPGLPTSFIHGFTLSVVVRVSASLSTGFGLGFLSGVRLNSFYTAEYQSRTAVAGVPLPPVVVTFLDASGSLYATVLNESISLAVTCASCTLSGAQATLRNGFFVFPGIVVAATTDTTGFANLRLRFVLTDNTSTISIQHVAVRELQSGPLKLVSPSSASSAFAVQFVNSKSSFIGDEDLVVSVRNGSSVPAFVVDVVRFDGLLAGLVQTVSKPLSDYADDFSLDAVVCNVSDPSAAAVILSVKTPVTGGRAEFALPTLSPRNQRLSLQCCLVPDTAAKSCTNNLWVRVLPSTLFTVTLQSISAITPLPTLYPAGTSLVSSWVAGSMLSPSLVDMLIAAYCEAPTSRLLAVCTSVGGINVSARFSTLVDTLLQPTTASSTTSMEHGFSELTFSLPRDNSTPPDGLGFAVTTFAAPSANDSESSWEISSATEHYAIQPTSLSAVQRLVVTAFVPPQSLDPFVLQIRLALKLQTEPSRLLVNRVTPSVLPRVTGGLRGSRIEVQVLPPFTFAAKLDSASRLQNQLMATQHSCLQEATVDRAASPTLSAPLVAGYLESAHSLLFGGTVSDPVSPPIHCDVELFGALAESSRHCELFMGSAARCSCFLTLFATLGTQCAGSLIFLHVCDHMAYCVDAQIADVCALVQPNVPLQVFAVVGGTALAIVVFVVILKSKTILMVIRERSVRMHDNQQHVLSRQSATSMQVFSS